MIPFLVYHNSEQPVIQFTYDDDVTFDLVTGATTHRTYKYLINQYAHRTEYKPVSEIGMDNVRRILSVKPEGLAMVEDLRIHSTADLAAFIARHVEEFQQHRQYNPAVDLYMKAWEDSLRQSVKKYLGDIHIAATELTDCSIPGWEKFCEDDHCLFVALDAAPESVVKAKEQIEIVRKAQQEAAEEA